MLQEVDPVFTAEQKAVMKMYSVIDKYALHTGRVRREARKGAEFPFGKQLNIELKGGTAARRRRCAQEISQVLDLAFTVKTNVNITTVNFLHR